MKTIKVGIMPGRISEVLVEGTSTIQEVLEMANLDSAGYDVKVDGTKVTNLDEHVGGASLIYLVKQVKGNAQTIKVGIMPGRISEILVEAGQTVGDVLEMADLDPTGYDVKVDGTKVNNLDIAITPATALIYLVKQVKGN